MTVRREFMLKLLLSERTRHKLFQTPGSTYLTFFSKVVTNILCKKTDRFSQQNSLQTDTLLYRASHSQLLEDGAGHQSCKTPAHRTAYISGRPSHFLSDWLVWTLRLAERIVVVWLAELRNAVRDDRAVDRFRDTMLELAPRVVDLVRKRLIDGLLERLGVSRLHAKLPHVR